MPNVLFMPSSAWDAQPSKKRRVTIDELEQDFLRLSLAGRNENVELDTLLQTLTLKDCGPTAPPAQLPTPSRNLQTRRTPLTEADSRCRTDARSAPVTASVMEVCSVTEVRAAECGACTAIVPFHQPSPSRQRRWRRIPRIAQVPRCLAPAPPAKFAVDSEGTAFVLPESVRIELSRARDQWKRGIADEERNVTSTAIVIYQKPRKHDLVDDFMSLTL